MDFQFRGSQWSVESWDRCELADSAGAHRRHPPVTPGVTRHRRCAPAPCACNTRCYRRTAPVRTGAVRQIAPIPTFHGLLADSAFKSWTELMESVNSVQNQVSMD